MEWIKIKKYKSDGVVICRSEDIDYLSSTSDFVVLHLKNGEDYRVESGGLFELLRHVEKSKKIPDLKLENDRLKRRNELMEDYIHAVACIKSKKSKYQGLCDNVQCPYYNYNKESCQIACTLGSRELIEQEAADIIEKLEEL